MGSKLIAIVGESGTGKSTSVQSLDPKDTYIINVAGKELPFRGSEKLYNTENKNYYEPIDAKEVSTILETVSSKKPHVKHVIIEDANYLMGFNLINKASETGYTKFNLMAKDIVNLIQGAKKLRDDLVIYYFTHPEPIMDGEEIVSYKFKSAGKVLDNQINLAGLFTVVLYTEVEEKGGKFSFNFATNKYKKLPAKSPIGMFEDILIPNNLKDVTEKVVAYYN